MTSLSSSDLKSILHAKRANIYYWYIYSVMQKNGLVLYLLKENSKARIEAFLFLILASARVLVGVLWMRQSVRFDGIFKGLGFAVCSASLSR